MIIACATDDKIHVIKDHFGDAEYYNIYSVDENDIRLIKTITNNVESHVHPDPSKGIKIIKLLKKEHVDMLVNRTFGLNIKTVKKYLLPVVIREDEIEKTLVMIKNEINYIQEIVETKPNVYIVINNETGVRVFETA